MNKKIPNKMILTAGPSISQKEIDYVLDAVKNGWNENWNGYIKKFEKKFAEYVGTKYAMTTSSCTGALHLALAALGIKEGDEVILPDLLWIAPASAVRYLGGTPVFVDIESDTWCIDPGGIKKAITKKTKAIIPAHLYGHPANMDEVNKIAEEYGLYVIEDAAPSLGGEYKGKRTGSLSDVGCFSFQGAKLVVTGEGGMLVTNDDQIYERAEFLGDQGRDKNKQFWIKEIGFKYKMSNIQAAIGLAQLERINEFLERKRQIFNWYKERLEGVEGLRLNVEKEWAKNTFWMSSIVLDKNFPVTRDELRVKLKERNIDTRSFFYPMSQFPMFEEKSAANPISYKISKWGINLPSGVNLTEEEVNYIAENVKELLGVK